MPTPGTITMGQFMPMFRSGGSQSSEARGQGTPPNDTAAKQSPDPVRTPDSRDRSVSQEDT